jgi:hypothetical protein
MMAEPETRGHFHHRLRGKHVKRIRALAEKLQKVASEDGRQVPSLGSLSSDLVHLAVAIGLNEFEKMDIQQQRDLLELSDV